MERSTEGHHRLGITSDVTDPKRRSKRRRRASLLTTAALTALLTGIGGAAEVELPGPLSTAHQGLEDPDSCENCHDADFNVDGTRCLACHDQIEARMTARKGVHREATTEDCAVCHAEHGGRDADLRPIDGDDFDHSTETGFPLEGYHGEFAGDCSRCHTTRSFLTLKPECSTCHQDVHRGTLGDTCSACHTVDSHFKNASRAFHKSTFFPLQGRHLEVPCASCHWDGMIEGTPTRCYDCHWIRRQDDPFRTRLGNDCENCHQPISWTATTFNHAVFTGYPLGGQHQTVDCAGCHPDRRFDGPIRPDCYSCHRTDYESTRDPEHAAAGFPTQCDLCHRASDASWNQGRFIHAFQLVGRHSTADCSSCHGDGVYRGTPSDCVGCHLGDYESASDPNHPGAGFPTDCELCHRPTDGSWRDATFNHAYRLAGVHATLQCAACHSSSVYQGLPSDCVDCHRGDYDASTNPRHQAAGFSTVCNTCHLRRDPDWRQATYPHDVWPLVGAHTPLSCSTCHTGNAYMGLPSDCVNCHLDDYNATDDPNHPAAGFPTDCEQCHTPTGGWDDGDGGSFNHPFQLVGVHATLDCTACHSSGVYEGLPSDCVDCHIEDYDATTDPDHPAAGFPTDCEQCHSPAARWDDGTGFEHPYQLVGVHATLDCGACHGGGVYAGTPTDCVGCHLQNYNGANDPNHRAAGFPTDCELCHRPSDASWNQGTFNHGYFPITGGPHASADCVDCHTNPSNFRIFNCLDAGCHPRSTIDEKHDEEDGYVYDSAACYSCHPDGRPPGDKSLYRMRSSHASR